MNNDDSLQEYLDFFHQYLNRLFPICRSLTGDGLRETLNILREKIPLSLLEIPSGTEVYDWTIPLEWNIRDAFIKDSFGKRVVDFQQSNLHVVNYSEPIHCFMSLEELRPKLHTLPLQPDSVPYLTSYYKKDWGFCLTHRQLEALEDGEYEVCIDSSLSQGSLTLGECVLEGETKQEIMFSTYCCHPSMANNELSGPLMAVALYLYLSRIPKRRYTYRFFFGAETIGALTYLSLRHQELAKNIRAGFVLTCCGDNGNFTYKKVRRKDNILDKIVLHTLQHVEPTATVRNFFPTGSDERQYSAPGFNLPFGSLMRTMYGTNPEYHTSLDNLDFVKPEYLLHTFKVYIRVLEAIELNGYYDNLKPFGEPFLSKYNLYHSLGGQKEQTTLTRQLRYILNFSDGTNDLIDIAEMLNAPVWELRECVNILTNTGLLALSTH